MEMVDAHWTKMVGTACASWAGGVRDVTPPWKLLVEMEKIMMEVRTCFYSEPTAVQFKSQTR